MLQTGLAPLMPPTQLECECYYRGLPSQPLLVARTGSPWLGIHSYGPWGPKKRDLRVVGNHLLKDVWEDNLAFKLHALLDLMKVKWTSTDVVRIGYAYDPESPSPAEASVILWIGVTPASLSGNDGVVVVSKCRELLEEHNIADVEVEIRESVVTRSAGPKLLPPSDDYFCDPTIDFREPLTTMLGLPICAQSTPRTEGTGGFFITEGGDTKRLLLVTARHVVLPPDMHENTLFKRTNDSQPRHNVTLFGDAAFEKYVKSIQEEIRGKARSAEYREDCVRGFDERADDSEVRKKTLREFDEDRHAMEALFKFSKDVSTRWAASESRLLGHVILSPPINASEGYTEDWAVIEIDPSKVDSSNFSGNAIQLGTRFQEVLDIAHKMFPESFNPYNPYSFKIPLDRVLRLTGTIPDEEPTVNDEPTVNGDPTENDDDPTENNDPIESDDDDPTESDDDDPTENDDDDPTENDDDDPTENNDPTENEYPCLKVMKRGNTTGLTIGRANNICSYSRNYNETAKDWPILQFDSNSGPFSAEGDSGSVIVDRLGRIGGLLTGGAGSTDSLDITYATPISFLLKSMQRNGLHEPNVNPVLAA